MRCQDVACRLQAHTGTGKTIAFLLPALQRLLAEEAWRSLCTISNDSLHFSGYSGLLGGGQEKRSPAR